MRKQFLGFLVLPLLLTGCFTTAEYTTADDWYAQLEKHNSKYQSASDDSKEKYRELMGQDIVQINKLDPNYPNKLLRRGIENANLYRLTDAEANFKLVTLLRPEEPYAYKYLGIIAYERGNIAAARSYWTAAVSCNEELPDVWNNLGVTARLTGAYSASTAYAMQALTKSRRLTESIDGTVLVEEPNPLFWANFNKSLQK